MSLTCFASACGHAEHGACGDRLARRNPDEVVLCNDLAEPVLARFVVPEGEPPKSGWPTVILLHGSGGLFEPVAKQFPWAVTTCSEQPRQQFARWEQLLTERGYAVLMPDSFLSRGSCDELEHLSEHEQLIVRVFDAWAAAEWACERAELDCDALALLGFSNGASVALLSLQHDLEVTADERLHGYVGASAPALRGAIVYYPGCGFEGELPSSLDEGLERQFYAPLAPVVVHHAERDPLLEICEDIRDEQVDELAEELEHDGDWFRLRIYPDAAHGFDVASEGPPADLAARKAAQSHTLATLDEWLD